MTDFVNRGLKTVLEAVNRALVYKYSDIIATSQSELHCHRLSVTIKGRLTVCNLYIAFRQEPNTVLGTAEPSSQSKQIYPLTDHISSPLSLLPISSALLI